MYKYVFLFLLYEYFSAGLLLPTSVPIAPQRRRRQGTESELIAEEPRRISRHSFVSVSLSVQEIRDLLVSYEHVLVESDRRELYMKRILTFFIMLGVLAVGVATRLLIEPADLLSYYAATGNETTTFLPADLMNTTLNSNNILMV